MDDLDRLVALLDFKREVMNQVPLVSTLLAVLAMSGICVLLAAPERSRLRSNLFVALTIATLLFIFATVLDAAILPGMKRAATERIAEQMRGSIDLSRVVVWSVLCGILFLMAAVSGLGFLYSRRTGSWV